MTAPHLLVLEDDAASGALITLLASRSQAVTRVARSVEEFFDLLANWPATHLSIDLKLPGTDGVQVLSMLANRGCRLPVLVVSGVDDRLLASVSRVARENQLAIHAAVQKPIDHAVIAGFLTSLVPPLQPSSSLRLQPDVSREALHRAFVARQYTAHLQPKIDLNTGRVLGYEALARWQHPLWGLVPPDAFIGAMERNGCIDRLTDSIVESSFRWLAETGSQLAGDPICIALNVSAHSVVDAGLADRLLAACARYSLDPAQVELEVTESCAMREPKSALTTLTRLRLSGFSLALDDFGTGYSSMSHLARLPFTSIKLDQSFVRPIVDAPESRKIVASLTNLGKSLGLHVVAEGVETQAVANMLGDLGCDSGQGYLYSAPLTATEVPRWHVEWIRRHTDKQLTGAAA